MSRINTNVSAIIARNNLARANDDLKTRLQRLSTGLAINRGADNPAGLIVSERLRSEISAIQQSIGNTERASNVIATTEASLSEVAELLTSVKSLAVEAANTGAFSQAEIEANQLQVDSAVASITRIANSASFAGLKLLNGSLDYVTTGVNPTNVQDVKVFSANFGTASTIPVNVEVINSAERGQLYISGYGTGSFASSITLEVTGNTGTEVFTFASGTSLSAVLFAINQVTDATGVTASLRNPASQLSGLYLTSGDFGSDAFVSVRKLSNATFFNTYAAPAGAAAVRDTGQDVLALVNGSLALGDGTSLSLHSTTLSLDMKLTNSAAQALATHTFTITGGGANFQIGPHVNSQQQIGFGIGSVTASHLGDETVGFLSSIVSGGANSLVAGNQREAASIIDVAIDQIAILRGRLGAFERNTLQSAARSQQISLENLTASESNIRDADFAYETSKLTRAQILTNAGTSILALANSQASSVLSLLQG